MTCCGLDFGTSNSAVAIPRGNTLVLAPVDDGHATTPTAIFYGIETGAPVYGRRAVESYIDGEIGRLLRGLKSILGTTLVEERTRVGARDIAFKDVIGGFLGQLKRAAEAAAGQQLDSVVLGRPVHFVATSDNADQRAEATLVDLAKAQGFRHVAMQYEPIAAALHYETMITAEELVLIVDIGGGTSDFSVVRVSPERARSSDREGDILANAGVRLGGTDFDQRTSLATVMPLIGLGALVRAEFGKSLSEAPRAIFHELSIWHRIIFAYTTQNLRMARELRRLAVEPDVFERLIMVLEERLAHRIAAGVEDAKIAVSTADEARIGLDYVERGLDRTLTRETFEEAIRAKVEEIGAAAQETVRRAGLTRSDVSSIFYTGGSSNIPMLRATVAGLFPEARTATGDMFGSVGLGLGLDAMRKFGAPG